MIPISRTSMSFSFSRCSQQISRSWTRRFSSSGELLSLVKNGEIVKSSVADFIATTKPFSQVFIDLGAGDGKYIYRQAIANPANFYIGVDSLFGPLCFISKKIAKKPSKGGGQKNIAFVHSSVETLPSTFSRLADSITINFPWGTLLQGVVTPTPSLLGRVAALGKEKSSLEILVNYTVFEDPNYVKKMNLPPLTPTYIHTKLPSAYRNAGIDLKTIKIEKVNKNKTKWGMQLFFGNREVLLLSGKIRLC